MVRTKSKDLTKDDISFASTSKSNSPSKDEESQQSVRVGGRMKKAKVVFDPSINNMPRRRLRKSLDTMKPHVSIDSNSSMGKTKRHSLINNVHSCNNNTNNNISNNDNAPVLRIKKMKLDNSDDISENKKAIDIKIIKSEITSDYYNALCLVCFKSGIKKNDRMIACKDCNYKAHLTCLKITNECINTSVLGNNWQCSHCKTCAICFETSDAGILTTCCFCNDAYHAVCHTPRINLKVNDASKWKCKNCNSMDERMTPEMVVGRYTLRRPQQEPENTSLSLNDNLHNLSTLKNDSNLSNNDAFLSSSIKVEYNEDDTNPGDSTNRNTILNNQKKLKTVTATHNTRKLNKKMLNSISDNSNNLSGASTENLTLENDNALESDINDLNKIFLQNLPDPTNWTYDDVYKYFVKIFPNEAEVFKEHEIDGSSLLLMKRSDIISGMNLKLGPAVKIYNHITMIQTQSTDPRLTWM